MGLNLKPSLKSGGNSVISENNRGAAFTAQRAIKSELYSSKVSKIYYLVLVKHLEE